MLGVLEPYGLLWCSLPLGIELPLRLLVKGGGSGRKGLLSFNWDCHGGIRGSWRHVPYRILRLPLLLILGGEVVLPWVGVGVGAAFVVG